MTEAQDLAELEELEQWIEQVASTREFAREHRMTDRAVELGLELERLIRQRNALERRMVEGLRAEAAKLRAEVAELRGKLEPGPVPEWRPYCDQRVWVASDDDEAWEMQATDTGFDIAWGSLELSCDACGLEQAKEEAAHLLESVRAWGRGASERRWRRHHG